MEVVVCVDIRFRQAAAPQREHILKLNRVWWVPARTRSSFSSFPYVSPEPVLEK
jgi:hypothetical protein